MWQFADIAETPHGSLAHYFEGSFGEGTIQYYWRVNK